MAESQGLKTNVLFFSYCFHAPSERFETKCTMYWHFRGMAFVMMNFSISTCFYFWLVWVWLKFKSCSFFQPKDLKGWGKNARTKSSVKIFSGKRGHPPNQVVFLAIFKIHIKLRKITKLYLLLFLVQNPTYNFSLSDLKKTLFWIKKLLRNLNVKIIFDDTLPNII